MNSTRTKNLKKQLRNIAMILCFSTSDSKYQLIDNITTLLDFVLISGKKITENIINDQMLKDEEHYKVTATVSSQIIDLYNEIKDKYDFAQFFTNDGISQIKVK